MKSTKKILLLSALTIGQVCYAILPDDQDSRKYQHNYENSSFEQSYNAPHSTQYSQPVKKLIALPKKQQITADSLTQESYITPEMLEALMLGTELMDSLKINITTGAIENIPSVETLLEDLPVNESAKKSLHTMLEATHIALFVQALSEKYDGLNFNAENELKADLEYQKQNILNRLNAIDKQTSLYSWIFGSSAADTTPYNTPADYKKIPVNQNSSILTIPVEFIKAIVNHNNYKQKPNSQLAATILFQQCFIAQQHRFPNPIALTIRAEKFTPILYIYNSFPQFHALCDSILKLDKSQRRSRLLQIRQAVQTALFIANKKSATNIDYIIPKAAMPYLDGVIAELMRYDNHLNNLCKDARYGATQDDMAKVEGWSTMSKVAAGLAVAGAVVGAAYAYDKFNGTNNVGNAYNVTADILQTGYNTTAQTIQSGYSQAAQQGSDVMKWLSGSNNKQEETAHQPTTHTRTGLEKPELVKQDDKKLLSTLTGTTDALLNTLQADTTISSPKSLQAELQQAEKEYAAIRSKGLHHPEVIQAEERRDALKEQLDLQKNSPLPAIKRTQQAVSSGNTSNASFWEQRLANAHKGFDRGIDHAQLDADEEKFQAKATEIKIRNTADILGAGKAAGLNYESYEQNARNAAEQADKKYKGSQQEAEKTESALNQQKRLLETSIKDQAKLEEERERKERELKRAQASNPNYFFDTTKTADARAKMTEIKNKQQEMEQTIQFHKDELSDLERSSMKNQQTTQDAKNAAEQAKQAAENAKFTRQVAAIVEKGEKPFLDRVQETKESIVDTIKSLPYDIQNFSLPSPESALKKPAHERTGLDKAALIKETIQKPFIEAKKQAEWENSPAGQAEALVNRTSAL